MKESTMDNDYPALYVFVRTDMPSMNPGKAQAHSGHAANAFVHENVVRPLMASIPLSMDVLYWMKSTPQGFGTQINLKGDWNDIVATVASAKLAGFCTDLVVDPTYPYFVDSEIVELLDPAIHTQGPIKLENGKFLCFRSEATAAYIFGYKSALEPIVGGFGLHP